MSGQPLTGGTEKEAQCRSRKRSGPSAASDDPEVEAHRTKGYGDEEADREGAERRETGEESDDVEAHRHKA